MSLGSGSEGTIIEEIDRRIITEVTTQEMRSSAEHGAEEYSEMSASHQAHFAEGGEEAADYEHETRDVSFTCQVRIGSSASLDLDRYSSCSHQVRTDPASDPDESGWSGCRFHQGRYDPLSGLD